MSFIAKSCKPAKTAYFAGPKGTKAKEIPDSIFNKHFAGISNVIKTSYFSKTTEKQDGVEITKFCFQPGSALAIQKLDKVFPGYNESPSLPDFTKPASTESTVGLSVSLKADNSLFAG